MPAWGVMSGKGALNEQSIQDLVNYLYSIATTPDKAQAGAAKDAAAMRKTLDERRGASGGRRSGSPTRPPGWPRHKPSLPRSPATRPRNRAAPPTASSSSRAEQADVARRVADRPRSHATDGEVLFMNNCARCHTRGWSYFDPADPEGNPAPGPMGGGAYGPNLTGR